KPGQRQAWEYYLVVAPPVRNVVYCSPELIVGVGPHPTGLPATTRELTLSFAGTDAIDKLHVAATLVTVADPTKPKSVAEFDLTGLTTSNVVQHSMPVELSDATNYQLRLRFTRDGQPWFPGQAVGDRDEVIVPLVVGRYDSAEKVFPLRTKGVA